MLAPVAVTMVIAATMLMATSSSLSMAPYIAVGAISTVIAMIMADW